MPDQPISEKGKYPALTGIRAIAAFMVFFHHLPLKIKPDVTIGLQLSFYTGVTWFFVLSGFLIAYRYYETAQLSRKWMTEYFIKRFARIYPVYFFILTLVILYKKEFNPLFLLQNYTLTHNLFFVFKTYGMAIEPSWSLTVEECFYILAPFIFILTRRFNLLFPFFLCLSALALMLLNAEGNSFLSREFPYFFSTIFGRSFEFFTGIFLAKLIIKKEQKRTVNINTTSKWTIGGLVLFSLALLPLIYSTNSSEQIKYPLMVLVNNFILPIPIAIFYFGLICERTFISKTLSGRAFNLFGKSSYAFYLLHVPIINLSSSLYLSEEINPGYYNIYVLLIFILTLVLSIILFKVYEYPVNNYILKKFIAKKRAGKSCN